MTTITLTITVIISVAAVLILAWIDPKRRQARQRETIARKRLRYVLIVACLLPGGLLLYKGEIAFFSLWLGAVSFIGWLTAYLWNVTASRAKQLSPKPTTQPSH